MRKCFSEKLAPMHGERDPKLPSTQKLEVQQTSPFQLSNHLEITWYSSENRRQLVGKT